MDIEVYLHEEPSDHDRIPQSWGIGKYNTNSTETRKMLLEAAEMHKHVGKIEGYIATQYTYSQGEEEQAKTFIKDIEKYLQELFPGTEMLYNVPKIGDIYGKSVNHVKEIKQYGYLSKEQKREIVQTWAAQANLTFEVHHNKKGKEGWKIFAKNDWGTYLEEESLIDIKQDIDYLTTKN